MKVVNMKGEVINECTKASDAAALLWLDAQCWDDSQRPVIVDIGDFQGELVFSDRRFFAKAEPHLRLQQ